jgi:hypothetical protein
MTGWTALGSVILLAPYLLWRGFANKRGNWKADRELGGFGLIIVRNRVVKNST